MKVRYTARAKDDIGAIYRTIRRSNPRAAQRVRARIRSLANELGGEPRRGSVVEQRPGVRRLPVVRFPYAIYFTVEQSTVVILQVRHGARQFPSASEL